MIELYCENLSVRDMVRTRTWHDKNIQSNVPYRYVLTTLLSHLASLTKWLSVGLGTKCLWVRVRCSHLRLFWERALDIQATIECGFTLKRVYDMIRTYSQGKKIPKLVKRWVYEQLLGIYTLFLTRISKVISCS